MADDSSATHATRTAGATARRPREIPRDGLRAVAARLKTETRESHLSLLAAGVAFKSLLALFPAIIAAVSVWGLVTDPERLAAQLEEFADLLPEAAADLVVGQMTEVAGAAPEALSAALVVSVLVALWSASGGMLGLVDGCNAAYDEFDTRSFVVRRGLALLLTLGAVVFVALAVGLIVVVPAVMDTLGLGAAATLAIRIGQWPLLALMMAGALAVVYRFGPDRVRPKARWVTWGAAIATVLWLLGSALFTVYVENFGTFGETYGALAGVIVLMLWLMLTSFVVLFGAEINAELERQTVVDTTVGPDRPLGQRGAVVADTTPGAYRSPEL